VEPEGVATASARTVLELYRGGWRGGTAAYLTTLLPALARHGYRPVYAGGRGDVGLGLLAAVGVETRAFDSFVALAAWARQERVAIVHSHGVRMNLVGRAVAQVAGAAQVVTVHSRLEQDYRSRARLRLAEAVWGLGLGGARAVIAVSEAVRADLLRRGVAPSRVHVVDSGVDEPPPPWPRARLAEVFTLPAGALATGTVARHHPVKGLDTLLDALALVANAPDAPSFVHLLIGDGPETQRLMARARHLGIEERVRFAGYRDDARAIVGALDLFVLPSRAEGFGLAALEAMAAGVAVVATRAGNLPALLGDGRLGALVPVDDAPALAAAMRSLLASPARRAAYAAAARARYLEAYSIEAMATGTARVLDSVGPGGGGGAGDAGR
jgi:glycosyltransferase involved in cell wall biosynthesis